MITDYQKIRSSIEKALKSGRRNFIIYPFGEYGGVCKKILNDCFGVKESYIIDNKLSEFNPLIKKLEYFNGKKTDDYMVLLTNANPDSYESVREGLTKFFSEENIVDIFERKSESVPQWPETLCGKYSYGPLCNHRFVESVGAFCSFATGADVVENHSTDYLSTHPFMYADKRVNPALWYSYEQMKESLWYFGGVTPKACVKKLSRIKIGNDVWLGRNVIITNGSNIGNGVIAGAGAIITKDVPDYAIVTGVPAKIIRYRYTEEQIEKLNAIAWWDWPDEVIRERYEDFYIEVNDFIWKYYK